MPRGSICEPVEVNPAALIRAERVTTAASDRAPDRFAHFHDAAELVWFRHVSGELVSEDGRFTLGAGTLVFVPPMRQHDFAIPGGEHAWVLVHLDPFLTNGLMARGGPGEAAPCRAVSFDRRTAERIDGLFDWLVDVAGQDHHRDLTAALVAAILAALFAAAAVGPGAAAGTTTDPATGALDRLRPALDLIARNPARALSLGEVASVCHLSEAYFSRSFKRVFGQTFSAYLRDYRLRLAAQRLLSSGERVSVIAHQAGFASPAHMTEQFRRRFGVAPSEYRAGRRQGQARDSD
ncbi:AraC family transcriptional regulator [Novosphingobium sp.]|uniref:helix-turn-helix transcriptional regulator n=1 Tax=Novosphingobium sp. TaxID=1874826 RepID=UPI0026049EF6|nr:AraC family transcriptional regulator [Novosphingobium sp.]